MMNDIHDLFYIIFIYKIEEKNKNIQLLKILQA
jgi:hypothetical protein